MSPSEPDSPRWYERERPSRPGWRGLGPDLLAYLVLSAIAHAAVYGLLVWVNGLRAIAYALQALPGGPASAAACAGGLAVLYLHVRRHPLSTWTTASLALTATGLAGASDVIFFLGFPAEDLSSAGPDARAAIAPACLFGAALLCGLVGLVRTRRLGCLPLAAVALLLPAPCAMLVNANVELQRYLTRWFEFTNEQPLPRWSRPPLATSHDPHVWRPIANVQEGGAIWIMRNPYYDPEAPDEYEKLDTWMRLVSDRRRVSEASDPLAIRAESGAELRSVLPVLEVAWSRDIREMSFAFRVREGRHPRPPLFRWHHPVEAEFAIPFPPSGPIAEDGVRSTVKDAVVLLPGSTRWEDAVREVERALDRGAQTVAFGLEEPSPR